MAVVHAVQTRPDGPDGTGPGQVGPEVRVAVLPAFQADDQPGFQEPGFTQFPGCQCRGFQLLAPGILLRDGDKGRINSPGSIESPVVRTESYACRRPVLAVLLTGIGAGQGPELQGAFPVFSQGKQAPRQSGRRLPLPGGLAEQIHTPESVLPVQGNFCP